MKKGNNLKITLIVLLILLLSLIGFVGIYVKKQNRMTNLIPDYKLGMDLDGYRLLQLEVNQAKNEIVKDQDGNIIEDASDEDIQKNGYIKTEEPVNKQENLTAQNYEKVKKILEKRLKDNQFSDYIIRIDYDTGNINIQLKENQDTDKMVNILSSVGKFELIDTSSKEVLMDNRDIKQAKVMYSNATNNQTVVYLDIVFNKEAKAKLEQISKTYVSTTDSEGNKEEKKVTLTIDGQTLIESSFEEPITTGQLQLSLGSGTANSSDLQEYVGQASLMATLLNSGNMPITYEIKGNKFMQVEDMTKTIQIGRIALIGITFLALVYFIIRYRKKGILVSISYLGFVSLFLLVLRLTNVQITIDSIFAFLLCMIINYILMVMVQEKIKKEKTYLNIEKQIIKKLGFMILPFYSIAIVFSFVTYAPINTFGMTLFWGLTTIVGYNLAVTKVLLEQADQKENTEER